MHTIFACEHNYLIDTLTMAYPSMTEDELLGTARNIIAAVLAKIHTLEWSSTLSKNAVSGMAVNVNWYGLWTVVHKLFSGKTVPDEVDEIIDETKVPSVIAGEYPTALTLFNTLFYMT